jgi:hypothetical protein
MKRCTFLLFLLCAFHFSWSQNEEIDLEQFAERLFQVQDQNLDFEDIYESLLLYYTNKVNLNKVEPSTLASLYILSPLQLSSFFEYRDRFGDFLSINELQAIPNFDVTTVRDLKPFVTVDEKIVDSRKLITRIIEEENNYLLLRYSRRLEAQKGFTPAFPPDTTLVRDEEENVVDTVLTSPNRYRGSADKLYGRFRTSHKDDFSLGFTFEKDPGEKFEFDNNQYGFDFWSYHLMLDNKLGFKRIMVGDYQLQVGQGLVFGAGFTAGKGAETVNTIRRSTLGLRPYTSVLEAGFFRGVGLTKALGDFEITGFYSNSGRDGNILRDTTFSNFNEFVNSIRATGLHRTEAELALKNRITEESYGGMVTYRPIRRLLVGISGLLTNYSVPIQRRPNNYNQFEFSGRQNDIYSAFFSYTWQNFSIFGEGARSTSGGIGAVGGFMTSLSPIVDFAMLFRRYDRDFHSFYGNAFSENSRNINEQGTYWGLAVTPSRKHRFNLYYDHFRFPWLKFGTESPSDGYEWLVRYTYRPTRQITAYIQGREQLREVTLAEENLNILVDQVRRNFFFNIDYELKPRLKLKTKVQTSTQQEGNIFTSGFAILQDVNFEVWELKFYTRAALFDTDNFDNAQYVYENDVLYAFSIPAYNGVGVRNYVMVRYDPIRDLSLWIRYGQFSFRDRDTVGSGLDESEGPRSSELKIMVRKKF